MTQSTNPTPGGNGAGAPTIDLDQFLAQAGPQPTGQAAAGVALPDADRVVVVGILADDSGSICQSGLEQAVVDGLTLSVDAFRGARGSDFSLDIRGFKGPLFQGLLKEIGEQPFAAYCADVDSTPLVGSAIALLTDLHTRAEQYRALGIHTTVALLIITDGYPNGESHAPQDFRQHLVANDYVVGMGIGGDEASVGTFRALFTAMGIAKTVTPKSDPAEVRHAINQFSQSVASIGA